MDHAVSASWLEKSINIHPLKETNVPKPDPVLRESVMRNQNELRLHVLV